MRSAAAYLGPLAPALALLALLAATPAATQDKTLASHDSTLPIELNADSLEVQQENQLAIFSGNVVATQGDIVLRADTLKVHYQQGGDGEDQGSSISRIDALGHVFISSPKETAQGDNGVYDVTNKNITLNGSVVLTRGENVIRGNRLALDLATGRSRVDSGVVQGGGQERVKAIFVPPKKEKSE